MSPSRWSARRCHCAENVGKSCPVRQQRAIDALRQGELPMQGYPAQLHGPYIVWTRKVDSKTVTRVLSPEQLEDYRLLFDNAKRLRELVTELQSLTLDVVDSDDCWRTR